LQGAWSYCPPSQDQPMSRIATAKERVGVHEIGAKLFPSGDRGRSAVVHGVMTETLPSPSRRMDGSGMILPGEAAGMWLPSWQRLSTLIPRMLAGSFSDSLEMLALPLWFLAPRRDDPPPWMPQAPPVAVVGHGRKACATSAQTPRPWPTFATWRGWPVEVVRHLAEAGKLGLPRVRGSRGVGWLVEAPSGLVVGFHARLKPRPRGAGKLALHSESFRTRRGHPGLALRSWEALRGGTGRGNGGAMGRRGLCHRLRVVSCVAPGRAVVGVEEPKGFPRSSVTSGVSGHPMQRSS